MDSHFESPSHLLRPDESHSLHIVPATVSKLAEIKGPVVIVTICGTQRGGKSTLLNLLRNRTTGGFGVGHAMDPQTTGLWVWDRKHPRNPDLTILLVDSEGLDAPHVPAHYNWTLSAIALLISSYFIYQTTGQIDSHTTERLSVILKVAEQLKGGRDLAQERAGHVTDKPHFMWVIRDHHLTMTKDPKSEMVDKMNPKDVKALSASFASYDCHTLPRPVDAQEDLQNVEKMPYDNLKSDFREEYSILERIIFKEVSEPRHLAGRVLTGEMVAGLVTSYAEAVASRSSVVRELSQLPTSWQMVARVSGERAVKVALKAYQTRMAELESKIPVTEQRLANAHDEALSEAKDIFYQEAMVDDPKALEPEHKEFYDLLLGKVQTWQTIPTVQGDECVMVSKLVGGAYFDIWSRNASACRKICHRAAVEAYAPVQSRVEEGSFSSAAEFQTELAAARQAYDDNDEIAGLVGRDAVRDAVFVTRARTDRHAVELSLLSRDFAGQIRAQQEALEAFIAEAQAARAEADARAAALADDLETARSEAAAGVASAREEADKAVAALREVTETKADALAERVTTVAEAVNKAAESNERALEALAPRVDAVASRIDAEVLPKLEATLDKVSERLEAQASEARKAAEDAAERSRTAVSEVKLEVQSLARQTADIDASLTRRTGELDGSIEAIRTTVREAEEKARVERQKAAEEASARLEVVADELRAGNAEVEPRLAAVESRVAEVADEVGADVSTRLADLSARLGEVEDAAASRADMLKSTVEAQVAALSDDIASAGSQSTQRLNEALEQLESRIEHVETGSSARAEDVAAGLRAELETLSAALSSVQAQLESSQEQTEQTVIAVEKGVTGIAKKNEQVALAIDALWESMGGLAARIVNVESNQDKHSPVSSQKASSDPHNVRAATSFINKFRQATGTAPVNQPAASGQSAPASPAKQQQQQDLLA